MSLSWLHRLRLRTSESHILLIQKHVSFNGWVAASLLNMLVRKIMLCMVISICLFQYVSTTVCWTQLASLSCSIKERTAGIMGDSTWQYAEMVLTTSQPPSSAQVSALGLKMAHLLTTSHSVCTLIWTTFSTCPAMLEQQTLGTAASWGQQTTTVPQVLPLSGVCPSLNWMQVC